MLSTSKLAAALTAVLLAGLTAGCSTDGGGAGGSTSTVSVGPASASAESARQIVLDDGREVFLECHGSGSPTVVLESGYHDSSDLWVETDSTAPVEPVDAFTQISSFTRVCRYDRPGTLRYSDNQSGVTDRTSAVSMPRSAADVVLDLHEVLDVAGEPGPFVLVAHSLGGIFSRLYAQTYPDQVSGLVFVDSFPIEIPSLFGEKWPAYQKVMDAAGSQPDPAFEQIDVDASIAQVNAAAPLDPTLAMLVLTKTEPFAGLPATIEGFTADDLEQAWTQGALHLVALGSQTPQWLVTGSDHYVQVHQPDLVAAAARLVIGRTGSASGDRLPAREGSAPD